ncbi:MAG: hypothetical protein ABIW19_02510 [Vicinamibacterales bacterium]
MRMLASGREIRRAERRLLRRFCAVMLIAVLTCLVLVAVHRLFGWW